MSLVTQNLQKIAWQRSKLRGRLGGLGKFTQKENKEIPHTKSYGLGGQCNGWLQAECVITTGTLTNKEKKKFNEEAFKSK